MKFIDRLIAKGISDRRGLKDNHPCLVCGWLGPLGYDAYTDAWICSDECRDTRRVAIYGTQRPWDDDLKRGQNQ